MEQPNWMKRFLEWDRDIHRTISDKFYDGKTGLSLKDVVKKKEEYSEEFSEGCGSLKNLLCHLWDNNIETMACCSGHAHGVHYEKDTLFGRMVVSESVAMKAKEKKKKGYYRVEDFSSPYLMFKCPGNCKTVSEDIKKCLEQQGLSFEYRVSWDDWDRISIHNESFGPGKENTADLFLVLFILLWIRLLV